LRFVSFVFCL